MSEIRIYVACLASYSNGILHGKWIDATQGEELIWTEVKAMLAASSVEGAEEYEVHDHEGFEGIYMSGNNSFSCIAEMAEFIEEHGALGAGLMGHFGNIQDAFKALEECYSGEYESLSDFAEQVTQETTNIPENLRFYIDYEKMGRELEINDVFTIEIAHDEVHVFWSH